jgi:hypothetical protein
VRFKGTREGEGENKEKEKEKEKKKGEGEGCWFTDGGKESGKEKDGNNASTRTR